MISPELLQLLATLATGAGAAFAGGRNSLNGFKTKITADISAIDAKITAVDEKVAAVQARMEEVKKDLRVKDDWHDLRITALEAARRAVPLDEPTA